ncbi:MAG: metal ABC transporter substrate-binding protein [Candidatus Adiutrix sp.]|jgi:ABC-type Zn uptake system ZnuABC Zn-binding protein ZnuA|nr:metal ABC transporter substrate-binding protein [Candidatus Adiutrix sp.]
MRRSILILLAALVAAGSFGLAGPPAARADDLLCSTFPVYLFTRNIVQGRDHFQPELMIDSALGCPHDYAPTPADLERLSQAQALVINGLGLEGFLGQALKVARPDLQIVDASGGQAGAIIIDKKAAAALSAGHDLPGGPNPHLFASPGTAALLVNNIAEGLSRLDPEGREIYQANAARLSGDLTALAGQMGTIGEKLGRPKVITGHSIFEYLAADLGLTIVATIEEEDGAAPTAGRLAELTRLARREGVRAVLTDPEGNLNLARTLGAEAKVKVAVIDPVSGGPRDAPLDYYQKVMLTDLEILIKLFAPGP